jgi:hypothetical protein
VAGMIEWPKPSPQPLMPASVPPRPAGGPCWESAAREFCLVAPMSKGMRTYAVRMAVIAWPRPPGRDCPRLGVHGSLRRARNKEGQRRTP